jgi:hypothetical protein
MKIALIACAPLVLLAACANVQSSTAGSGAQPASGTMYCWKDKLEVAGDKVTCNWASSAREACESTYPTTIAKAKLAGDPQKGNRCSNGQWLVSVQVK